MAKRSIRYKHNRLQQLRGFYYAAQNGSISRAAEKMYLSQPSVSLQIQALEREFDAAVNGVAQVDLALKETVPGGGVGVLEIGHEHLRARV